MQYRRHFQRILSISKCDEDFARATEEFLQAFRLFLALVDVDEPAPQIEATLGERGAIGIERAVPVEIMEDEGVLTLQIVTPAVKGAGEAAPGVPAHAIAALWHVDQRAPAMRADVVERAEALVVGSGA